MDKATAITMIFPSTIDDCAAPTKKTVVPVGHDRQGRHPCHRSERRKTASQLGSTMASHARKTIGSCCAYLDGAIDGRYGPAEPLVGLLPPGVIGIGGGDGGAPD